MNDREPLPTDGPDYHAEHGAWVGRQRRDPPPHHRVEYAVGKGVCQECSTPERGTFKVWPCRIERKRRAA